MFKSLPQRLKTIQSGVDKKKYHSVNVYFQDGSRFGLKTHVGTVITAKAVAPSVKYPHQLKYTYLHRCYSPLDGSAVVLEHEKVNTSVFEHYLERFFGHRPDGYKIMVIDNAGFHSTRHIKVPDNICLLRLPPYSPELNPCEQIWQYIKQRFKNRVFESLAWLRAWLNDFVGNMNKERIQSIVGNRHCLNAFYA